MEKNNKSWKVYVHINIFNDKRYVGITSKEKVEHRWSGGRGYKKNPCFYEAINKYGWDNFRHIVLVSGVNESQAKNIEMFLIKHWRTQDRRLGYNMTQGGEGTKGCIPSAETRNKLSIARRKENLSEETLRRRSEGLKGRKFSDTHKRKIGDANSKPVEMFDLNGMFIASFKSLADAEATTFVNHSHISQCCNHERKTSGGYIWRYAQ